MAKEIQTGQLLELLKRFFGESFKYSRLDFYFRKEVLPYEYSKIGMGKTRFFSVEDATVIKLAIDIMNLTSDIELTRKSAKVIDKAIREEKDKNKLLLIIRGKEPKIASFDPKGGMEYLVDEIFDVEISASVRGILPMEGGEKQWNDNSILSIVPLFASYEYIHWIFNRL